MRKYPNELHNQQDLVFFSYTKKNVDETVEFLNKYIKDDRIIALPIYRGVNKIMD